MKSVTKNEIVELDRKMIQEFDVSLKDMMEQAGMALADLTMNLKPDSGSVLVLVGRGNNGGGGLVAARHLQERGMSVSVILSVSDESLPDTPRTQLDTLRESPVKIFTSELLSDGELADYLASHDIVLDCLLGYGVSGAPRGPIKRLIDATNQAERYVIALDMPSGLFPDEGVYMAPIMRADATLTLAVPKIGLGEADAREFIGELFVADIGVPVDWYGEHGFSGSPFMKRTVVSISDWPV